jgi:hypothetical protein
MARNSAKNKARELYIKNPRITLEELKIALGDEVLETTVQKYLIEFQRTIGHKPTEIPDKISMDKLEKELAWQLNSNPTTSVVKSCIDFLRLKQMTEDTSEEIDIEKFLKKGKEYLYI